MSTVNDLYSRTVAAMNVKGLEFPVTAVKFFKQGEDVPESVLENKSMDVTLTSCQATRMASLGDAAYLEKDNIGCIAAGISLGLIDQNQTEPMQGPRTYTNIMRDQSGLDNTFTAPTPSEFTEGIVYGGCQADGRTDFALFGKEDSGRFKDVASAKSAVAEMTALQPAEMRGVFFYSPDFDTEDIIPDIVVLSLRPVELARFVQAYSFSTGKRINSSMGTVRVVNSDLIVRPFLTQEINVSTYCIGARLIGQYGPDRMGMGIPFHIFKEFPEYMEKSSGGYPFQLYPGADEKKG